MNATEFNEWRKHHGLCVAGFDEWLAKGRSADDQREVLRLWADALGSVSLADAKEASKALMRGDIERVAFGEHPAVVRRYARSIASKRYTGGGSRRTIDGHELVDCPHCEDTGFVTCYHPKTIREYVTKRQDAFKVVPIRGGGERRIMPSLNTCAVPCTCTLGAMRQKPGGSFYDDTRWIRKTAISTDGQIEELIEGIDERLQAAMESRPNYTQGFAEWNNS